MKLFLCLAFNIAQTFAIVFFAIVFFAIVFFAIVFFAIVFFPWHSTLPKPLLLVVFYTL
jgi:hypothetical protein